MKKVLNTLGVSLALLAGTAFYILLYVIWLVSIVFCAIWIFKFIF